MKRIKMLFLILTLLLPVSSSVVAGDFDWFKDFNIKAEIDPSGIRARLATRFKIGIAEIEAVLSNVEKPSDAYMVFRLGEMSNHPLDRVIDSYKAERQRGWGALAKRLGIRPGSRDFHALKQGESLYGENKKGKHKNKGKGKKEDSADG